MSSKFIQEDLPNKLEDDTPSSYVETDYDDIEHSYLKDCCSDKFIKSVKQKIHVDEMFRLVSTYSTEEDLFMCPLLVEIVDPKLQ